MRVRWRFWIMRSARWWFWLVRTRFWWRRSFGRTTTTMVRRRTQRRLISTTTTTTTTTGGVSTHAKHASDARSTSLETSTAVVPIAAVDVPARPLATDVHRAAASTTASAVSLVMEQVDALVVTAPCLAVARAATVGSLLALTHLHLAVPIVVASVG